jgi:mRNA interferase MazF
VDLDGGAGSEQRGSRPALVISNDGFNRHFQLATVLPLTKRPGKRRRVYAFEVLLPEGTAGNEVESIVMPHQVRTISRERVGRRLGSLRAPKLRAEVEARLLDHLGIGFDE